MTLCKAGDNMGILLQALAALEHSSIITIANCTLLVGQSDKDAADVLLENWNVLADGKNTVGDTEAILLGNFLETIREAIGDREDITYREVIGNRRCKAMLDALWWFRFIECLYQAKEELTKEPTPEHNP